MLGKCVLINYENGLSNWVELKKVRHCKDKEFKVIGESDWYSTKSVVNIPPPELYNLGICLNCKLPILKKTSLLCHDTHCWNMFKVCCDVGFTTTASESVFPKIDEKFRDLRLVHYRNLRANLWSKTDSEENIYTCYKDKLYSIKHGKFLPKSRCADRRLKWKNRGKRYNLHAH